MEQVKTERDRKLEKIKKLLAMGRDDRGNEHEVEAAMRMANKLMAELGIEEAEVNMAALDNHTMEFGVMDVHPDGKELGQDRPKLGNPWAGPLAIGVAEFCDVLVEHNQTRRDGHTFRFKGEKEDLTFAAWLFKALVASIQAELARCPWIKARSKRDGFRSAAAGVLHVRLSRLRKERKVILEEAAVEQAAAGFALVVVDRKQATIEQRWGKQVVKYGKGYSGDAASLGRYAGTQIHIPTDRPISHAPAPRISG